MRILVSGWSGFIGRALGARLVEAYGAAALVYLARPPASLHEAECLARFEAAGSTVIIGDLREPGVSSATLPRVDAVFHLAANIDTTAPASAMRLNDQGTEHLLAWAGAALSGARVIYTSSVAVMDRTGPAGGPLTEASPCVPRTPYGLSKLRGEEILKQAAERGGFSYTIARLPTVYGPGQKSGGMFDLLANYASTGAWPARLNWPGRTSVMFVDDVAAALVWLAFAGEAAGETYCLSSGETLTVAQLASTIGRTIGHPIRRVSVPAWAWKPLRRLIWLPTLHKVIPSRAAVTFWRLSLIVDDGFWCDDGKFRSVCDLGVVPLTQGLAETFRAWRAPVRSFGARPDDD